MPLALIFGEIRPNPNLLAIVSVIYLALIPTAMGNYVRFFVIRSVGPSFQSLAGYQIPIWAVIFGFVFLDEALHPWLFFIILLIILGMWLSQSRPR